MNSTGSRGIFSTVTIVIETILLIVVIIFALSAYSGEQKYKNNVDGQIAAAVNTAVQKTQATDATKYAQQAESPLSTYSGPSVYGSLVVKYPKTYSAYVDDSNDSGALINGWFDPGTVPSINNQDSVYALRIQVLQQTYDQVITQFTSLAQGGMATVSAYSFPQVSSVVGIYITGSIGNQHVGEMVVVPDRQNTIEVWTEAPQYYSDFNNMVLPNFSFAP